MEKYKLLLLTIFLALGLCQAQEEREDFGYVSRMLSTALDRNSEVSVSPIDVDVPEVKLRKIRRKKNRTANATSPPPQTPNNTSN